MGDARMYFQQAPSKLLDVTRLNNLLTGHYNCMINIDIANCLKFGILVSSLLTPLLRLLSKIRKRAFCRNVTGFLVMMFIFDNYELLVLSSGQSISLLLATRGCITDKPG